MIYTSVIVAFPSASSTLTKEFIEGLKQMMKLVNAESSRPADMRILRLNRSASRPFTNLDIPYMIPFNVRKSPSWTLEMPSSDSSAGMTTLKCFLTK